MSSCIPLRCSAFCTILHRFLSLANLETRGLSTGSRFLPWWLVLLKTLASVGLRQLPWTIEAVKSWNSLPWPFMITFCLLFRSCSGAGGFSFCWLLAPYSDSWPPSLCSTVRLPAPWSASWHNAPCSYSDVCLLGLTPASYQCHQSNGESTDVLSPTLSLCSVSFLLFSV